MSGIEMKIFRSDAKSARRRPAVAKWMHWMHVVSAREWIASGNSGTQLEELAKHALNHPHSQPIAPMAARQCKRRVRPRIPQPRHGNDRNQQPQQRRNRPSRACKHHSSESVNSWRQGDGGQINRVRVRSCSMIRCAAGEIAAPAHLQAQQPRHNSSEHSKQTRRSERKGTYVLNAAMSAEPAALAVAAE